MAVLINVYLLLFSLYHNISCLSKPFTAGQEEALHLQTTHTQTHALHELCFPTQQSNHISKIKKKKNSV